MAMTKGLENLIYHEKLKKPSLVSFKVTGDLITFWEKMCGEHKGRGKSTRSQWQSPEGVSRDSSAPLQGSSVPTLSPS